MPSPPNLPSPSTSLPDFSALKLFQRKQRGEAQSESEARELRASEAQRATRHKTRKGRKNDYSAPEIHLFLVQKNWTGRISRDDRFRQ
jgi:hypothetical protein